MRYPRRQLGSIAVIAAKYRASEPLVGSAVEVTTRLAREVAEAVQMDPMYGPQHDKERYMVGVEFEVILECKLKSFGESTSMKSKPLFSILEFECEIYLTAAVIPYLQ